MVVVLVVEEEAGTKEGVKAERRSTRPEADEGKAKCLRGVTLQCGKVKRLVQKASFAERETKGSNSRPQPLINPASCIHAGEEKHLLHTGSFDPLLHALQVVQFPGPNHRRTRQDDGDRFLLVDCEQRWSA